MQKKIAVALLIGTCGYGWHAPAHAQSAVLPPKKDVAGTRPQPEFDAAGIRLGPWVARPSLRMDTGYDDNLFGTPSAKTGDGYVILSPALALGSDWAQHGLDLSARGDFTRYYNHKKQRSNEYALRAGGRLDLGGTTTLVASTSTSLLSERNGANGAPLSTGRPSQFQDTNGKLAISQDLSHVRLSLAATHGQIRYNDLIRTDGSRVSQSFRDSNQWSAQGTVLYAPTDIAALGITASYQRNDADNANRSGDSISIAGKGGVDLGMIRIEGEAGYLQRHYNHSALRNFNGLSYSGAASWYPTSLLSLTIGLEKNLENSGNPGVGVIVSRRYHAEMRYELLRNLVIDVAISEKRQNFREIGAHAATHTQEAKGEYKFNRSVAIGAYARHECRDSTRASNGRGFCSILTGVSLIYRR